MSDDPICPECGQPFQMEVDGVRLTQANLGHMPWPKCCASCFEKHPNIKVSEEGDFKILEELESERPG